MTADEPAAGEHDEVARVVAEEPSVATEVDDLELAEGLQRIERKPPLYRAFRGAMYTAYIIIAIWVVSAITVAAWRSVWGESGDMVRKRDGQVLAVEPASQHQSE